MKWRSSEAAVAASPAVGSAHIGPGRSPDGIMRSRFHRLRVDGGAEKNIFPLPREDKRARGSANELQGALLLAKHGQMCGLQSHTTRADCQSELELSLAKRIMHLRDREEWCGLLMIHLWRRAEKCWAVKNAISPQLRAHGFYMDALL